MSIRPHDITDMFLSPVALHFDRRLAALTGRTHQQIDLEVALATNREPRSADERARFLLESLTQMVPAHGWDVSWDRRGLRLSHADHEVTLGIPDSVREYLAS